MIRYDNKLNSEIKRTINNYNAKVRRLEKKGIDVPDKIYKKDIENIKKEARSRKELRKVLTDLRSFTKRGSEIQVPNTNLSRYEYNKIKRLQREANRNLNRQIRDYESIVPSVFGKKQVLTSAQMKEDRYINLLARKETINQRLENISKKDVNKFIRLLERNKYVIDYEDWQKRYLGILEDTLHTYDIENKDIKLLTDKLQSLDPLKFDKLIRTERSLTAILDYYSLIKDLDDIHENDDAVISTVSSLVESIDDIIKDYK